LHRAKVYPQAERDRGQQGHAAVRFAITRAGGATGVALVRSSGNAALDQAAIAMVHRAAPFPPLPAEFGPSVMTLTAPVS
ncbi:energy transducer TonB, partial [Klebsiella pneumoniae]|uniref:energy transducer TonB n=1 Tax=Klebsiella pneumoniae TaxID=573 RepID=UPI0013D4A005